MKKIIKLKESDMKNIINEQGISNSDKQMINDLVRTNSQKSKSHYIDHFSEQETINKFKNKNNVSIIKNFIPTITYKPFIDKRGKYHGYVNKKNLNTINLNLYTLFSKNGNTISPKGSLLYDTILHEMGHLIDYKLQSLGEKSLTNSTGYYQPTDGYDNYVQSDAETFARIQRLREVLGASSIADGKEIRNKIIEFIKSKKIQFPNVKIMADDRNAGILIFEQINQSKGVLTDLWKFYNPLKINNTSVSDISALFAKYSKIENGKVILDLNLIGKVNASTKGIIKLTESDLRKIIKRIISEQFDMDYYDIILDLYNEVGLEGMTDEEIKYLKSGGQSNVPERFLGGNIDIDDDESEERYEGLELFKEIMGSNRHKVVDTAPDGKLRVVFKESEELLDELSNIVPESLIDIKQGYIIVIIPENWMDDIFGEEI
jgi:hypothetical protein